MSCVFWQKEFPKRIKKDEEEEEEDFPSANATDGSRPVAARIGVCVGDGIAEMSVPEFAQI